MKLDRRRARPGRPPVPPGHRHRRRRAPGASAALRAGRRRRGRGLGRVRRAGRGHRGGSRPSRGGAGGRRPGRAPPAARPARPGAASCPPAAEVSQLFGGSPVDRMLAATFEMAVADAELRAAGRSLADDLGVGEGFEAMAVGAVVGIPDGHDLDALRRDGRARRAGRSGPGAAEDRAGLGGRAGARRAGGPPRPRAPGRRQRLLQRGRRGRGGAEPPGRLRRAVHRAAAAAGGPGRPRPAGPRCCRCPSAWTSRSRRRGGSRDALRNGSCAMACLKPARLGGVRATRAAHAACAAAGVPAFVGGFFEAGLGRAVEPGPGGPAEPGRDGPGQRPRGPRRLPRGRPVRLPARGRRLGPGPDRPGVGNHPDAPVLERLEAQRRWFPATYT